MQYFLTIDTMSDISLFTGQFTCTSDDVARAAKMILIAENAGAGSFFSFFFFVPTEFTLIEFSAVAPPWFQAGIAPLQNSINQK